MIREIKALCGRSRKLQFDNHLIRTVEPDSVNYSVVQKCKQTDVLIKFFKFIHRKQDSNTPMEM